MGQSYPLSLGLLEALYALVNSQRPYCYTFKNLGDVAPRFGETRGEAIYFIGLRGEGEVKRGLWIYISSLNPFYKTLLRSSNPR